MTRIFFSLLILLSFASCNGPSNETDVADEPKTSDAVVTPADEIDGMSIYQLTSAWKTQDDKEIQFADLRGDVLVVVMIYTSCQSACPRLVGDMKDIESRISSTAPEGVRYVLVSIDPKTDTPARLKKFSLENEMADSRWLFLQGTEASVREFANVLAVRYARISPIDFSHSNIISVFDQRGVMRHQQEGLNVGYDETVKTVLTLVE